MRERGLKYRVGAEGNRRHLSLPVRERGLKYVARFDIHSVVGSLPVRERGLKSPMITSTRGRVEVAPCAGAWVEIFLVMIFPPRYTRRSLCGSVG